jgi:hypothetical protein
MPIIELTTSITSKTNGSFELGIVAVDLEASCKVIHEAKLCFDDVEDALVVSLKAHEVGARNGTERMAHVGSDG